MQKYQEVCGTEDEVWFEAYPKGGEAFLAWAKSLGCVWINGEEIEPKKDADFFHFSIRSDGKIAKVAAFAWVSKQYANVPKYSFFEYQKGKLVSPKE